MKKAAYKIKLLCIYYYEDVVATPSCRSQHSGRWRNLYIAKTHAFTHTAGLREMWEILWKVTFKYAYQLYRLFSASSLTSERGDTLIAHQWYENALCEILITTHTLFVPRTPYCFQCVR